MDAVADVDILYELFTPVKEQAVTFMVEVCLVVWGLEVSPTEGGVHRVDATGACGIEHGEAMSGTHLTDGLRHLGKAWPFDCPRRNEADGCPRVLLAEPHAKRVQSLAEQGQSVAAMEHLVGIVVSGDDEHEVCRIRHLAVTLQYTLPEAPVRAVEGYAIAVAPVVAVVHA